MCYQNKTHMELIDILRNETQTLKVQYLESTRKWAENSYNYAVTRSKWSEQTWCEYFGLTSEVRNPGTSIEFYSFPKGFHNTANSKTYRKIRDEISSLMRMGFDKFLEKEIKKAENHYENSLQKLTARIQLKGLDVDNMKITSGRVGVNIDITLTDGDKTVRAYTIVAEGDIQRPHYRYLVK